METFDNWIGGGWVEPARRMDTTTPFTGDVWASVADDPAAVDTAVAAARTAFDGEWGAMSGAERGRCMRRRSDAKPGSPLSSCRSILASSPPSGW